MPSNLRIQAGARALTVLREGGLKPEAIQVIVGSAGGPKWLILSQVSRFLFGGWIVGRTTPLYLVGSSSEACHFAAAARVDPKVVLDWLPRKDRWAGLKTIAKVTGQPEVNGKNLHRNHLPFLQPRKPHPDYRQCHPGSLGP